MTGTILKVLSPAKINWTLRVLGRREDGFHEIESLVSAVTLYDGLAFTARSDARREVVCEGSGLPTDRQNLVVRAAELLAEAAACEQGMTCRLSKRIPVGGGLGGGSSNGASTLLALRELWGLDWSVDRLVPLAARLGSDVPLFLWGGSSVIRGQGERVTPVRLPWRGWIVLLLPGLAISTAAVYEAWRPVGRVPVGSVMDDLARGEGATARDAMAWMEGTFNMLEKPAMDVCPALREWMDRARHLASRPVRVSGSGSTLFTAFDTRAEAERFASLAGDTLQVQAWVVQPVEQASNNDAGGSDGDH